MNSSIAFHKNKPAWSPRISYPTASLSLSTPVASLHQWIRSNCTMHSWKVLLVISATTKLISLNSGFNYSLLIQDSIILCAFRIQLFSSIFESLQNCLVNRPGLILKGLPRGQMAEFFPGKRFKNGFLGDFSSFDFFIFLFHYDEAYLINFCYLIFFILLWLVLPFFFSLPRTVRQTDRQTDIGFWKPYSLYP